MPFDRNTTQAKPILPRVANTKSPLTPRLAAQHIKTITSPSTTRPQIASAPVKDDLQTPVKALINSNVTPRSSLRKSRLETGSLNTTPTMVTSARPKSDNLETVFTKPQVLLSPSPSPGTRSPSHETTGSSFFHASDVKKPENLPPPPPPPLKKAATFFYANGDKEENRNQIPSPPASSLGISTKPQTYRANGVPKTPTTPDVDMSYSRPGSMVGFPMRPPSPQKNNIHLTFRKGASQIISPQNRSHAVPILPPGASARSPSPARPTNTIAGQLNKSPRPHHRTSSIGSLDSSPSSRKSSLNVTYARVPPPESPKSMRSPPPISTPQLLPQADVSIPQSPNQPSQTPSASYAEAAANARRERKVLDLEISNSSLLAYNRQLEKEVRRQKSELRRFRRLSRAGRLSGMTTVTDDGDMKDDEDDSEKELDPDLSESENEEPDSSVSDDSVDSPTSSNLDPSRLEKDEKRLQVDLKRHRQLLVDSQKMNLSLKRCMTLSEDMIAEARRALEYQVCTPQYFIIDRLTSK
jgi:hypothetical protein